MKILVITYGISKLGITIGNQANVCDMWVFTSVEESVRNGRIRVLATEHREAGSWT